MWERSGQGEGGFLHEEEEAQLRLNDFGSLAGRSENALSNRTNFVGNKDKHFLFLWDLIDKYDLLKTCMQVIGLEFATASGDNVRVIYDAKRAQLKDDEDDDASSIVSKQTKSEMSNFGGGLTKLANNNVMIAKMQAQEKEKDRLAVEELHRKQFSEREKDRIFQQKQSLEKEISRLRQDKRAYLLQMSDRAEKRWNTRHNNDADYCKDCLKECIDDINEEIEEKKAKRELLLRDESDMTNTPQKSNVTRTEG